MPATRDPTQLVRHAAQAGDWRLVELLRGRLGSYDAQPAAGQRAYATLLTMLKLRAGAADHGDQ